MHTQGRASGSDVHEEFVRLVEGVPDGEPAVDEQEQVSDDAAGELAVGAGLAQSRGRVQPVLSEDPLPPFELGPNVHEDALHPFRVGPSRHPRHVRELLHGLERSATEIDRVHGDATRGIAPRQAGDQGSEQVRLAGLRTTEEDDVAFPTGEVEFGGHDLLLARDVRETEDGARLRRGGIDPLTFQVVALPHVLQDRVQREGFGKGRQPDRPHSPMVRGDDLIDGHLEGGALRRLVTLFRCLRTRFPRKRPDQGLDHGVGAQGLVQSVEGEEREGGGLVFRVLLLRGRHIGLGDHGGLEPLEHRRVHLEVPGARFRGQVVGVSDTDRFPTLGLGEGAQADPVGQVGFEALELARIQPLGGQEQVHTDGTSDTADRDEQLGEVGMGRE